MEKVTGYELLVKLFGEEEAEEFEINEVEDMDGVEDYEQQSLGVSGWIQTVLHSFRFEGKRYSVQEESHTSDSVYDSETLWDTFQEVEEVKTVLLWITHQQDKTYRHDELINPQELYEKMVSNGTENVGVDVDGKTVMTIEIKEYPGVIPVEFLSLFVDRFISLGDKPIEIIPVKQV